MTKAANLAAAANATAGNITATKVQNGGVTTNALAWVNFNGTSSTPITPRANYNIGSVTKNGTGDYTLNFTNAMTDANYVISGVGSTPGTASATVFGPYSVAASTSAVRIAVVSTAIALIDVSTVQVAIFGN